MTERRRPLYRGRAGLSEREYAAHAGISRGAVQKARASGRLVLHADGSIDAAASDGLDATGAGDGVLRLRQDTRNSSNASDQPSAIEKPYSTATGSPLAASASSVAPSKRNLIAPTQDAKVGSTASVLPSSRMTRTRSRLLSEKVRLPPVTPASGTPPRLMKPRPVAVIASIRRLCPWLRHLFTDGGYAGDKLRDALAELGRWTIEIIKRSDTAKGFEVLPRRWVVERTFAWLGRCRRLARDFEATIISAVAWVYVAHIRMLIRRLARA